MLFNLIPIDFRNLVYRSHFVGLECKKNRMQAIEIRYFFSRFLYVSGGRGANGR